MKNFKKNRGLPAQAGLIKVILLVVAVLVLAKYLYDIDVVGFLTQGRFKEILDKIHELGTSGWGKYKDILIKVWGLAKNLLQKIF